LGSKLGNKGKFIPMLMYRDGSCWMWPDLICTTKAYEINNFSEIEDCTEITIRLNLTADPETSKNKAVELGHPVINITAKPEYMGNG
ncbi:SAVED domain-containing protein, partial [Acinetobacter baumannii]